MRYTEINNNKNCYFHPQKVEDKVGWVLLPMLRTDLPSQSWNHYGDAEAEDEHGEKILTSSFCYPFPHHHCLSDIVIYNKEYVFGLRPVSDTELLKL